MHVAAERMLYRLRAMIGAAEASAGAERPAVPESKIVLLPISMRRWGGWGAAGWWLPQKMGSCVRSCVAGPAASRDFAQKSRHLAVEIK